MHCCKLIGELKLVGDSPTLLDDLIRSDERRCELFFDSKPLHSSGRPNSEVSKITNIEAERLLSLVMIAFLS